MHQHHHHNTPNAQAPRTSRPAKPGSNKPFIKNANKKSVGTSAHKHPPDKTKSGGQQVPQQGHQGQHSSAGGVNSKPQPLIGVVPLMPQQQQPQQQQSPQQIAPVGGATPAAGQQQNTLHSPQQQAEDTTPPKGNTVWKLRKFSATQIFREINFCKCKEAKIDNLESLYLYIRKI